MIGLVEFDVTFLYIHLQVNVAIKTSLQNGGFVQITDKEINEIKINSILKNTKDPTKFGVKLFQGIYFIFSINRVLQQHK